MGRQAGSTSLPPTLIHRFEWWDGANAMHGGTNCLEVVCHRNIITCIYRKTSRYTMQAKLFCLLDNRDSKCTNKASVPSLIKERKRGWRNNAKVEIWTQNLWKDRWAWNRWMILTSEDRNPFGQLGDVVEHVRCDRSAKQPWPVRVNIQEPYWTETLHLTMVTFKLVNIAKRSKYYKLIALLVFIMCQIWQCYNNYKYFPSDGEPGRNTVDYLFLQRSDFPSFISKSFLTISKLFFFSLLCYSGCCDVSCGTAQHIWMEKQVKKNQLGIEKKKKQAKKACRQKRRFFMRKK